MFLDRNARLFQCFICYLYLLTYIGGAVVVIWYLDLQLPVHITTKVVSSNLDHGEVCSIQHYVIKFVSGFLLVLWLTPPVKLTSTI